MASFPPFRSIIGTRRAIFCAPAQRGFSDTTCRRRKGRNAAGGRGIVRDPAAFLFDEPLSNLDAQLRLHMRAELKRLHRELQTTAIYVTHDQEEAIALGDRIVVMKAGVVQQCATPMEVYERPANRFVATFIGTPPMNFFDGTIRTENDAALFQSSLGRLPLPAPLARALDAVGSRPLVLGVRPEDLSLGASGTAAAGHVSMKVEVISPLGYVKDVRLRTTDGKEVFARVPIHTDVAVDASVPVAFPATRLHLFESGESGRNLSD